MRPIALGLTILLAVCSYGWQHEASAAGKATPTGVRQSPDGACNSLRFGEIELGIFRVSAPLPRQEAILTLEFQLYGTVAVADAETLTSRLEQRRLRVRHAVVLAVRAVTEQELADPDLKSLRERIRVGANGALDGPELIAVGFHKIDYVAE